MKVCQIARETFLREVFRYLAGHTESVVFNLSIQHSYGKPGIQVSEQGDGQNSRRNNDQVEPERNRTCVDEIAQILPTHMFE